MSTDRKDPERALSEREKMMRGLPYTIMNDPALISGRLRAAKYVKAFNDYPPVAYTPGMAAMESFGPDERVQILADLFEIPLEKARLLAIEAPFRCDYGTNIEFKGWAYMNYNVTILDCGKVTIGTGVAFGPSVQIYAATHSVKVEERRGGVGVAYPVTIGDDVWIGGSAILIGPCKIGNGVTVAAGAVVKGDFPDNVVVGGNPARILKHLDPPTISAAASYLPPGMSKP
ncbi:trimeric LpxA-like protein [Gautieria morchelliformis]|nr:trimeric LpxA-like protein [Gautieria morchelliformis]